MLAIGEVAFDMSYKYSTKWYQKRKLGIFITFLILFLLFIIGGGILWGFVNFLMPFNALPIAIILIVLGGVGEMTTFTLFMCFVDD